MNKLSMLLYSLIILLNGIRLGVSITKDDVINDKKKEEETVLTPEDFAHIPKKEADLSKLGIKVLTDPSLGDKVEGDMVVPSEQIHRGARKQRSAIRHSFRKWPNATIPYALSSQYGSYSRSIIAAAIDQFHKNTCIKFVPRDENTHHNYVYIYPDDGCYSLVGRGRGRQPLSLVADCIHVGIIVHELMHACGFYHEQSRTDRDQYIRILWENIQKDREDQFDKYGVDTVDSLGQPYDYSSIMHYGETAFSKNGKPTIYKPSHITIGQRDGLSENDIKELNMLYGCTSLPEPKESDKCLDTDEKCGYWLGRIKNFCKEFPALAEGKCRKSCGFCQPETAVIASKECNDYLSRCYTWKNEGYCQKSGGVENLMKSLCPKTCGYCT